MSASGIHERPAELLQRLIRFDTTNPPGAERECVEWIRQLVEEAAPKAAIRVVAQDDSRPNLIARLSGRGEAPPLLLQGHVDVVPAKGDWTHPPFGGEIVDGYVWGRGALDMKGGVAMMLGAFLRAAAAETPPPGDVILCILSDEEAGGDAGAKYVVENHADLLDGVRFAIGEFGGFTMELVGRRFYPVMVAEKQICFARATLRGPAGHGSLPVRNGAMRRLGRVLERVTRRRLPVHVTPAARAMIEAIAAEVPRPAATALHGLLRPRLTDRVLDVGGARLRPFDSILHNTASPTIVSGGESPNVIPGKVSVDLDCRLLPGFAPDDVFAELRALTGVEMDFEVVRYDPGPPAPDLGLFDTLAGILRELDPAGRPVPLLLPAVTDARHFARLGIQTYGYTPMQLPEELGFWSLIHAENERIPADSVEFGTTAIQRVLERFGEAA
jgi:acetylornithine deacetylase/succinyl-diaminopimelate desuccinylase-like protein